MGSGVQRLATAPLPLAGSLARLVEPGCTHIKARLATTSRAEATDILGRQDVLPVGERPIASLLLTDAMVHYGIG